MSWNSVVPAVGSHFASSVSSRLSTPAPTPRGNRAAVAWTVNGSRLYLRSACPEWNRPVPSPERDGELLYFYCRAGIDKLLLDGRGFVFRDAFLHGLGSAIDQVLGFLQTEAGHFANRLDHVDLVSARCGQDDGEFRLLFHRCRRCRTRACARYRNRGRCRCRYAQTRFQTLYQC